MNSSRTFLVRASAFIAISVSATAATAGAQRGADTTTRIVDRAFEAWRNTDSPGCAVGISRNGRVVYERGYGMANLETGTPITPASIFHVASISKQFTAMAIMLLANDGKLSIDDNIRKYLPEIRDYGTPITIRHLLTHTSGLRDQWELLALARGRFEEDRITEADVMDIVPRQTALNFTPGAEYLYSNTGFTLLAVIVKRVSGKSLRDFADERIFKPLGMTNTHFHDDYTMLVPGRTSAYAPRAGGGWRVSIPNYDTYGATSLFTTVGDLLEWEANLDNPVAVADRATIARMEAPTILTSGDTSSYGFGIVADRYRGVRVVGHNGADAGYRTDVERYPEHGLAIAVLCNAASANPSLLGRRVAEAYLGSALAPLPTVNVAPQGVPMSTDRLQRRAGSYLETRTLQVAELAMRNGKLMLGRQGDNALIPLSDDRMRWSEATAVFNDASGSVDIIPPTGRRLHFERRPSVAVTRQLLARYAGEYVSDDLAGAVYVVSAGDSTLSLKTGTSNGITARPVFADGFLGSGYTIQFTRSRDQITGFEISNGRMRRVKFARR
jgi:CubicO group peptidase (beta-lactamase class C family)